MLSRRCSPYMRARRAIHLGAAESASPVSVHELTLQDIFQFFSVQLTNNLKPPTNVRPLQPTRTKSNGESQSQLSQMASQSQASQRVTEVPYYNEYCYLLDSLASIKSVVLACDVPGGDDIITNFFEGFAQIVR